MSIKMYNNAYRRFGPVQKAKEVKCPNGEMFKSLI
jgi:hypothetical protein